MNAARPSGGLAALQMWTRLPSVSPRRTIMDLTGLLNDALSGDTVSQISQTIGADESSTSSAIQAALPMLIGGLAHQTSTDEGAEQLAGALERDQHSSVLDNLGGLISGALGGQAADGEGILGHIFGGQ